LVTIYSFYDRKLLYMDITGRVNDYSLIWILYSTADLHMDIFHCGSIRTIL